MTPRVSVVMAVHNGEKYLRQAIDSMLSQTFKDFEFVIIDDGSTDNSVDIINSYGDPRIRLIRSSENLGLTRSLNLGLDAALGVYIARMDSDDVSLPERLQKQVAYMDEHPEIIASGTWAHDIDDEGRILGNRSLPIGKRMLYGYWWPCPIIHPSAIIRKSLLKDRRYDSGIRYAQDYELWLRLRKEHVLGNLAEFLMLYRVHKGSISIKQTEAQLRSVHQSLCRHTGLTVSYEEFLELIGGTRKFNPLRRVILRGRLACAIHKPYSRYVIDELLLGKDWLGTVLNSQAIKGRLIQNLYSIWLRIRPYGKLTPKGRGSGDG